MTSPRLQVFGSIGSRCFYSAGNEPARMYRNVYASVRLFKMSAGKDDPTLSTGQKYRPSMYLRMVFSSGLRDA